MRIAIAGVFRLRIISCVRDAMMKLAGWFKVQGDIETTVVIAVDLCEQKVVKVIFSFATDVR